MSAIPGRPQNAPLLARLAAGREAAPPVEGQAGRLIALAVGLVAVLALVAYLALGVGWSQKPFIGALLSPAGIVDGTLPVERDSWPALAAGLQAGDRLVALDGQPPPFTIDHTVGQTVTLDIERPESASFASRDTLTCGASAGGVVACRVTVALVDFPRLDLVGQFIVPWVSGAVLLAAGIALLRLRDTGPTPRLVAALCFAQAVVAAGLFDLSTTHALIPLWLTAAILIGVCFGLLALHFPVRSTLVYTRPVLRYVPVVAGGVVAGLALYIHRRGPDSATVDIALALLTALAGLAAFAVSLLHYRTRAVRAALRDQSNSVLAGILLAVAPVFLWLINALTQPLLGVNPIPLSAQAATPFFILPTLSLVYAIFQTGPAESDRALTRTMTYGILAVALILGYVLIVFGISLVVGEYVPATNPPLMALLIFVIVVVFLPLRTRLQARIDDLFFRTRRNYQAHVEEFAQALTTLTTVSDILAAYRAELEQVIAPGHVVIFLRDRASGELVPQPDPQAATDIRFALTSPLVSLMESSTEPVTLAAGQPWPPEAVAERARLAILDAHLLVALPGDDGLNGLIVIGPPRSGSAYSFEALRFVRLLTQQIRVAVERAQVVASLEGRVRELDVLSRISQAVNFTSNFDDLLELLSTQAGRLLEATHVYIVLRDAGTDTLYYAFFLEDDERYSDRENRRWPLGRDLYSEIVQTERAIRLDDFGRAVAERDIEVAESMALRAWMGVPLIANQQAIGVLAVGSTRPGRTYSDDQLKIFTDISALAATSIDKMRLFDDANRRARQLAALNDISRQLVASESDLENLLALITANAAEMLNASAGALLLMADDNTALEYRVVSGQADPALVGTRVPRGEGLAGRVAAGREPVIVNDPALPRQEALPQASNRRSVLAVPLASPDRVIGVLEIHDKQGGPFTAEDADLLATFAGQAAIAIENARLFQMTDYQLSERVAELEALERIDTELNRSLDLERVAAITVRYAMEHSGATAGLLGIVSAEPPGLRAVALQGYDETHLPRGDVAGLLPTDRGIIRRVLQTQRADLAPDVTIDPDYVPGLPGARSQITVPMLSGGAVNAVLVLETDREPFNLAHLVFVQRLADHASIAIANAQLYAEVERANQSKSEFVSFVAHELKNPLTSIKGYSDFLISGVAGALSEQQRNFLTTIRANAERMSTLVSDLNDVTRLQTNNMRIDLAPIPFGKVVSDTVRPLQKQLDDKAQTLILDVPDDLPAVMGDSTRLVQVLTNLVSNAHKYSPPGGTIRISAAVMEDRRDEKGNRLPPMLEVAVRDTGIGISESDMAKLFTPYFRSDDPQAREQPGTGLGLTITHALITRHGGDIRVESELGSGTTFYFTLPLAVSDPQVST